MYFVIWFIVMLPFAVDVFAAGLVFGISGVARYRWPLVAAGLALLSATFIAAGIIIGDSLEGSLGAALKIVAGVLLLVLGLRAILESRQSTEEEPSPTPMSTQRMVTKSVVLAVDNLAVGISFALLGAPLIIVTGIVAVQCFVTSLLGLMAGDRLGARAGGFANAIAGTVFAVLGAVIFVQGISGT